MQIAAVSLLFCQYNLRGPVARWVTAVPFPNPASTFFAAWSSATWSWRQKWWASTRSWIRRGRSTPCRRSSCATQSVPRTTPNGGIRCCRRRWSSFSPRLVTSPQLATPQPQPPTPADRIVTMPSGYSEGSPGMRGWDAREDWKLLIIWCERYTGFRQDLAAVCRGQVGKLNCKG